MNTNTNTAPALQLVISFLLGEGPLNGHHFGEKPKGVGNFWWRNHLRAALSTAAQPYSIDADPHGIRARVADAITGALTLGGQSSSPPPEGHWLTPFWEMARSTAAQPPAGMVMVPNYRGYANLGTGQYCINHTGSSSAELIISIATDEEKAGRKVGEERDNPEGAVIEPEAMAVRLRFSRVEGLDSLEKQLRYLREAHFAAAPKEANEPVQPERAPMTDEQIEEMPVWQHFVGLWPQTRKEIARAIEAAHGIQPRIKSNDR